MLSRGIPTARGKARLRTVDRLQAAACRKEASEPGWWTDDHMFKGHGSCKHELARHICLTHCPVLTQCRQDMVLAGGSDWNGMVVAGQVRDRQGRSTTPRHPLRRQPECPYCR